MATGSRTFIRLVQDSDEPDVVETFGKLPRVHNIHRILANSPAVFARFTGFAHALRFETLIPPAERELAILCVLERHQGDYEAAYHRSFALTFDVTQKQVDNVLRPDSACYDDRQRAVLRFAARFAAEPDERVALPDDNIETYYDDRERLELALTLTLYLGLARFTNIVDVPDD